MNSFLQCSDIDIDITVSGSGTNTCTDYNEGGTISVTATVRLTQSQYNAAVSYITDAYNKFPEEYKLAFRVYCLFVLRIFCFVLPWPCVVLCFHFFILFYFFFFFQNA